MKSLLSNGARAALVLVFLGAAAAPARADVLFTPYIGVTFGGNADFGDVGTFDDNFERKVTFGGALTWMGAGIIGVEVDFGTTPNFFENTSGDFDFDFGDSNVTTLMGNLVVGAPIGGTSGPGVRPYASGGIGLLRSQHQLDGIVRRPEQERTRRQRRRRRACLFHRQRRDPRRYPLLPLAAE